MHERTPLSLEVWWKPFTGSAEAMTSHLYRSGDRIDRSRYEVNSSMVMGGRSNVEIINFLCDPIFPGERRKVRQSRHTCTRKLHITYKVSRGFRRNELDNNNSLYFGKS